MMEITTDCKWGYKHCCQHCEEQTVMLQNYYEYTEWHCNCEGDCSECEGEGTWKE